MCPIHYLGTCNRTTANSVLDRWNALLVFLRDDCWYPKRVHPLIDDVSSSPYRVVNNFGQVWALWNYARHEWVSSVSKRCIEMVNRGEEADTGNAVPVRRSQSP